MTLYDAMADAAKLLASGPDLRNADPVWMRTERTSEGYVTTVRFSWPRNVNMTSVGTVKSIEERLAEQHLDARFERVRRRWEAKHRDTASRQTYVPFVIDLSAIPPVAMSVLDNREII